MCHGRFQRRRGVRRRRRGRHGVRPVDQDPDDRAPGGSRIGWVEGSGTETLDPRDGPVSIGPIPCVRP